MPVQTIDTTEATITIETRPTGDGTGQAQTVTIEPKPGSAAANAAALDDRMDQALAGLRSYINTASPTNAQTITVVKLLCRVAIALIRRHRDRLDGVD